MWRTMQGHDAAVAGVQEQPDGFDDNAGELRGGVAVLAGLELGDAEAIARLGRETQGIEGRSVRDADADPVHAVRHQAQVVAEVVVQRLSPASAVLEPVEAVVDVLGPGLGEAHEDERFLRLDEVGDGEGFRRRPGPAEQALRYDPVAVDEAGFAAVCDQGRQRLMREGVGFCGTWRRERARGLVSLDILKKAW